jgi:membrane protease YdiL (CAAX protease family)
MSDEGAEDAEVPSRPEARASLREVAFVTCGVTAATGLVIDYAFDPARAGQASMLVALFVLYAALSALALVRLHRRGELRARFRPVGGDMTLGALVALLLYGGARIFEMSVTPRGSPREAWIVRLYLQIGDPDAPGRGLASAGVLCVAALEEIVWRGLVMRTLEDVVGPFRAAALTAVLFAIAHLPTLWLLRDPVAGLDPLVVVAALGCGLVWGLVAARAGRLVPALVAHALFSWAVVDFPLWRP